MSGWVGGSLRTCSFYFFWSRCCCCCCVLLLLPTSVLKRREVPPTVSSFFIPATTTAVSFSSILLLLLLLRRDMYFYLLVEVLLLLIIFLVGCAAGAGACAAYNISTESERGTGYCFFLLCFCRLHCDASDVYCFCCSWLLLFLSFRLRCFGYLVRIQIFLFHFPFDEIYRRLFFSLSGVRYPRE